jgi:hypothetical protein
MISYQNMERGLIETVLASYLQDRIVSPGLRLSIFVFTTGVHIIRDIVT